MPLETGTYISDLVTSNPAHTDGLNQGDGHLRLIKSCIQNTFKNFTDTSGTGGVGYLNSTQSQIDAAVAVLTGASGVAAFPAGTPSAPSIAFVGDTDTGFWHASEDQLDFACNGINQFQLTTSAANFAQSINVPGIFSTGAYQGGTGQLCPPGMIGMWLTPTAPTGWAFLNGQSLSTTANPILFSFFGYTFGGSGANFNLPNWGSRVPIGFDASNGIAGTNALSNTIGVSTVTLSTAQCPTGLITLNFNDPQHSHGFPGGVNVPAFIGSGVGWQASAPQGSISGTAPASTGITCSLTDHGGNGAHTNVQPSWVTNFIIKLG